MAMAIGAARWHKRRKAFIDYGAQMLLGPGEQILALRAKTRKVLDVETTWYVVARRLADRTGANRPSEAERAARRRGLS
jgi:hypothetical protein